MRLQICSPRGYRNLSSQTIGQAGFFFNLWFLVALVVSENDYICHLLGIFRQYAVVRWFWWPSSAWAHQRFISSTPKDHTQAIGVNALFALWNSLMASCGLFVVFVGWGSLLPWLWRLSARPACAFQFWSRYLGLCQLFALHGNR